MAFDGIVTRAVVNELNLNIVGGRISKIHQHEKDEILLQIRNKDRNYRLLISASSNHPRIYLTDKSKENPMTPPNFCMVLRKHLLGGRILDVIQIDFDRILYIDITSVDELGQSSVKRLIVEIMGKHSNIILVNENDSKIIDSIKKVNYEMSSFRQILPGLIYSNPPSQGKIDPRLFDKEDFKGLISMPQESLPVYKFLYQNLQGFSPLISREICFDSDIDSHRPIFSLEKDEEDILYNSIEKYLSLINKSSFNPLYISDEYNNIIAFHSLNLNQFGEKYKYFKSSISQVLDLVYYQKDNYDRVSQRSKTIRKSLQTKLDKALNKLAKQKDELLNSKGREKYKIYADLLSANFYKLPERAETIILDNFYDEEMSKIEIPVDYKFTPIENAQNYYKRYTKLKNTEIKLLQQIPETENEILYLENLLLYIENSLSPEDLDEIVDELREVGYLKHKKKDSKRKVRKEKLPSFQHYISKDDFDIFIGKNNKQNEFLTLKYAHKDDFWFHVQNMPGSHVILKKNNRIVPDSTLEEAALLAAYYSKGKNGVNISVDYTEKKNVRKIPNSKPGMVRYDNFNTIVVSPIEEVISLIKRIN